MKIILMLLKMISIYWCSIHSYLILSVLFLWGLQTPTHAIGTAACTFMSCLDVAHLNLHVFGRIKVEFSSNFTSFYLNSYRLIWIRLHSNKESHIYCHRRAHIGPWCGRTRTWWEWTQKKLQVQFQCSISPEAPCFIPIASLPRLLIQTV
jgi:hypothetical protein